MQWLSELTYLFPVVVNLNISILELISLLLPVYERYGTYMALHICDKYQALMSLPALYEPRREKTCLWVF